MTHVEALDALRHACESESLPQRLELIANARAARSLHPEAEFGVGAGHREPSRDTVDLLQIHNMHGVDELMPTFRKLKEERRVRYLGATTSRDEQYPALLAAMRSHPLDFVQVDYSIANRNAAAEVLPAATDRRVAVLVNMPFGGRRDGNLLRKLGERPLPSWATEFGADSWAEFLLKYVVSHPAITCAIPGTTSVRNVETNLRAAQGQLPDAAMRRRMEDYWDALAA